MNTYARDCTGSKAGCSIAEGRKMGHCNFSPLRCAEINSGIAGIDSLVYKIANTECNRIGLKDHCTVLGPRGPRLYFQFCSQPAG